MPEPERSSSDLQALSGATAEIGSVAAPVDAPRRGATAPTLADRARAAAGSDVVALGVLGVFTLALTVATWGTWGNLDSDTGYDAVAGARVAGGELPYADFVYFYGPLAPMLAGLVALVAGEGLGPLVGLGLVVAFAIVGVTYALARMFVQPLPALVAGAIAAAVALIPDNYSYVLPHTGAATLGTLALLLLLLSLALYGRSGRAAALVGAGACLGLLSLTKPEPAAAGLVAVVVWLGFRWRSGARVGREAALLAAPAFVIPVVVYGAFLFAVSPRQLLLENLFPVDELDAGGDTLVEARMPLTLFSFAELAAKLALYAAGAAAIVLVARGVARGGRLRVLLLVSIGIVGCLAIAAALANPEALRHGLEFAYGWIPAGALVAIGWLIWRGRRDGDAGGTLALEAGAVAALAVFAFTSYDGFFPNALFPQMAVYAVPLAAIFVARLHTRELAPGGAGYALGIGWLVFLAAAGTGLTLKDARAESETVRGSQGSLAETPVEAGLYRQALGWIERETAPGDSILVGPLMTALYPLTGRESPLRQISLLPTALPDPEDERDAIARLDAAGVRLVITDRRPWPGYGQGSFGETFDRQLASWLRDNFDHEAVLRVDGGSIRNGPDERVLDVWTRTSP